MSWSFLFSFKPKSQTKRSAQAGGERSKLGRKKKKTFQMGYRGYGLMYVCTSSACFMFLYYLLQPVFCYYFFFTVWIFLGRRRIYHVSAVDLRSSVERIIIPSALSNRSVRSLDFTIIYAIAFFFFFNFPSPCGIFLDLIWFN